MFERVTKSSTIQLRVTDQEKELIRLMVSKSPQQDISTWLMHLVKNEYIKVKEIDAEVANFGKEGH